jgi:hypothetical protein
VRLAIAGLLITWGFAWILQGHVPKFMQSRPVTLMRSHPIAVDVVSVCLILGGLALALLPYLGSGDDSTLPSSQSGPTFVPASPPPASSRAGEMPRSHVASKHAKLDGQFVVPYHADDVVSGGGSLWISSFLNGQIAQLDEDDAHVIRMIRLSSRPWSLVYAKDSVWITTWSGVQRLDPATGRIVADIPISGNPTTVAVSDDSIWTATSSDVTNQLVKIDGRGNHAVTQVVLPGRPLDVGFGHGQVWVALSDDSDQGQVVSVDPVSNAITSVIEVDGEGILSFTSDSVWLSQPSLMRILRIDPLRHSVSLSLPSGQTQSVASREGLLWVVELADQRTGACLLTEINGGTATPVERLPLPKGCGAIAATESSLWISHQSTQDARPLLLRFVLRP